MAEELAAAKDEIAKLRAEVGALKAGEASADMWMRTAGKRVRACALPALSSAQLAVGSLRLRRPAQVDVTDGRADSLKKQSYEMTGDKANQDSWVKMAQNRAHMRGAGFADADFTKPIITVAVPCASPTPATAPAARCCSSS